MKKETAPVIVRSDIEIMPDRSIDIKQLEKHVSQNPVLWEKAFDFLKNSNLREMVKGRYEIDGKNLYAIIDEYITKALPGTRLEAHRRYADIQYVISGEEKMGLAPLGSCRETVAYDKEKDICFLESDKEIFIEAKPDRYLVFLPDDAHRPGVMAGTNVHSKKIVIKVFLGE